MEDKKSLFIKIQNSIVWDLSSRGTLCDKIDNKILPIMILTNFTENRLKYSHISIKWIIESCNMSVKLGKGKTVDQFKQSLLKLIELNYLINVDEVDINKVKANEMITLKYNNVVNDNFFILKMSDFEKIMAIENIDNILLLKTYCYILARLCSREDLGEKGGGMTYFSYDNAIDDLKMSSNSYQRYINVLSENGLIYFDNIGIVEKDGRVSISNNVYATSLNMLKQGLKQSKYYYENEGYKIMKKKINNKQKKISGLMGKIKQEEKKGNIRDDLIKKVEKLSKK